MKIAITIGDSNGIGIEIFLKAMYQINPDCETEFVFYGSKSVLLQWLNILKFNATIDGDNLLINKLLIRIIDINTDYIIEPAHISYESGNHAAEVLNICIDDTLSGKNDAVVTLPISKEAMYLTGWKYPGHTEMIAEKCDVQEPMMILFKNYLRAALVTIHKPIKAVPDYITKDSVYKSINILNKSLEYDFGISQPRIAVMGLNPHAGENGNIGVEELNSIIPAINEANNSGINSSGPFPADGFFAHRQYLDFDAYLAMYHDQGLIPLKLLAKGGGVNFTAGLPIVRTSPDHGTAFGIAGKGIANPQSLIDAIEAALLISNNRKTFEIFTD